MGNPEGRINVCRIHCEWTISSGAQEFIAINADFKATLRRSCRNVQRCPTISMASTQNVITSLKFDDASGASAGKLNKMDFMELHVLRRSP